jgi:dolichol-phosphate mannosyltransferase
MNVFMIPFEFYLKLINIFFSRALIRYFLLDFNIGSVYLLSGIGFLLFGLLFRIYNWVGYELKSIPKPIGTAMIGSLSILFALQLILFWINFDLQNTQQ